MKKQVFNPYLPLYEYIPDGEPHVFNGRVYIYGSHDKFGAFRFCHNSYVTYSAPIDDLSDWRYEGVILDRKEDPRNKSGKYDLYAPDCTIGKDGNYYIYYAYSWIGLIGVAKSDSPSGPFKYLGYVHYKDGTLLGRKKGDAFQFDPGVLFDKDTKRTYLYSGFGADSFFPQIHHGKVAGCFGMELEDDMLTIKEGPIQLMKRRPYADDESKGHEFFEASSMRKINGRYYLIYSSVHNHELCYALSSSPLGPFKFGGVIISHSDVGLNSRTKKDAVYPLGNNHGSIEEINGKYYVFYHRHTNYTNTDRQGLAEEIFIDENGHIKQVETTSCGLNGKPLDGKGIYPASICCYLRPKKGNVYYPFFKTPIQKLTKTYITQSGKDSDTVETQYIKNIKNGTKIGYKYFDLSNTNTLTLKVKGNAQGKIEISFTENGSIEYTKEFKLKGDGEIKIDINKKSHKEALYIKFIGKGKFDYYYFKLN